MLAVVPCEHVSICPLPEPRKVPCQVPSPTDSLLSKPALHARKPAHLDLLPTCLPARLPIREGASRGYFVRSEAGASWWNKPNFFKWWNSPPVVALDVTNPEAVDWFVARLKRLQETTGIDGFKFDAGKHRPWQLGRGAAKLIAGAWPRQQAASPQLLACS